MAARIYHDVAASANFCAEPIGQHEFGTHKCRSMRWWLVRGINTMGRNAVCGVSLPGMRDGACT